MATRSHDNRVATASRFWGAPGGYNLWLGEGTPDYNRGYYIGQARQMLESLRSTHSNFQAHRDELLATAKSRNDSLSHEQRVKNHIVLQQPASNGARTTLEGTLIEYRVHRPATKQGRMRQILSRQKPIVDGYVLAEDGNVIRFVGSMAKSRDSHIKPGSGEKPGIRPVLIQNADCSLLTEIEPLSTYFNEPDEYTPENVISLHDRAADAQHYYAWSDFREGPALQALKRGNFGSGSYARNVILYR